jgi:hypothetical protein
MDELFKAVTERLTALANPDLQRHHWTPDSPVSPVRPFVKNEPHSAAKLAAGRARLIFAVSLVDLLVEMHLYYEISESVKAVKGPICIGRTVEEIGDELVASFKQQLHHVGTDCSMFDWTQSHHASDAFTEVVCKVFTEDEHHRLLIRNFERMIDCAPYFDSAGSRINMPRDAPPGWVVTSDGRYNHWQGIQKSGRYVTALRNSVLRFTASAGVRASLFPAAPFDHTIRVMGDDCHETWPVRLITPGRGEVKVCQEARAAYSRAMARLGLVIKPDEMDRSFCGLEVVGLGDVMVWQPTQASSTKALVKAGSCHSLAEFAAVKAGHVVAYQRLAGHLRMLELMEDILRAGGAENEGQRC